MFPTTVWTTIRQAAASDAGAAESFVRSYRAPVVAYFHSRGVAADEAEDLCQEVFLAFFGGDLLERADARRGRFRGLLLTVTRRTLQQRLRRRREPLRDVLESRDILESEGREPAERDPDFDREWMLALVERACRRMEDEGSPYYAVLRAHLEGEPQDRNKLWIARRKLSALVRHEVALTCSSPAELEEELSYLGRYLRPRDGLREDEKV